LSLSHLFWKEQAVQRAQKRATSQRRGLCRSLSVVRCIQSCCGNDFRDVFI